MNFKEIIENNGLTIYADVPVVDKETPPNKLAFVTSQPRIGALIAVQASNGLFPISQKAAETMKAAKGKRKQFDEVFVVLVSASGDFIKAVPARH
jgi:hypothetical protein